MFLKDLDQLSKVKFRLVYDIDFHNLKNLEENLLHFRLLFGNMGSKYNSKELKSGVPK